MEGFAHAEAERTRLTMEVIETSFSAKIADMADILSSQAARLDAAIVSMSQSAERSTRSSELIAHDAAEASHAVRTIAGSANELARSVGEIGRQISHCAETARQAADQARLGDSIVKDFIRSTGAIDEVTELIGQIADQTKLLALNATIEANWPADRCHSEFDRPYRVGDPDLGRADRGSEWHYRPYRRICSKAGWRNARHRSIRPACRAGQ